MRWEYWPAEVWRTLVDSVETCQSVRVHDNLYERVAHPVLKRLEADYHPLTMVRADREPVVAATVRQFSALLDNKYYPTDAYMRGFAEVIKNYMLAILTKSLSIVSIRLAEREMRSRRVQGDISVKARVREGTPSPLSWSVSRLRGITVCLKTLRAVTELRLDPMVILSSEFMESIRVANTSLHTLLFDGNPSKDRILGIMYFLSAVDVCCTDGPTKTIYLRIADALL